ncbi:unnamed protein product [Cylindrotheca closterium]|uniref:Sulfotransferase domain-containing protein n=1 Tax=Cylindrotheca closterium TaxID=2856 RepID=A0AAD2CM24_9STRA|nr:unnamed protein product [Cylindrotheca closterium]
MLPLKDTEMHNETNDEQKQEPMAEVEDDERGHILEIFKEAEVNLTSDQIEALPTWSQVQEVVGTHPYILNLESCARYRELVPPLERMLGSAGSFNTGTNLVTHLLKQNCEIPERREKCGPHESKECYGMRWQVPWGKHTPAKFRNQHATEKAQKIKKEYILPVVTMRNPYSWFKSMCHNSYAARWRHGKQDTNCPKLKDPDVQRWNPVTVRYGEGREDDHASLAHMWNDWYGYYLNDADYPYVVVRMEDLVFYPKETIRQVCECAGGKIRTDQPFKFVVESAKKDSPGHDKTTGIYEAWIKYSKPAPAMGGFAEADFLDSQEALNRTLMKLMGYRHPPAA